MKPDFDDLVGDLMIEVRDAEGRQRLGVRKAQEALLTGIQELQAINADLLAALELAVADLDIQKTARGTLVWNAEGLSSHTIDKINDAVAKARGEA